MTTLAVFAFNYRRPTSQFPLTVCAFIGLVVFVGFRFEVGPDWLPYIRVHIDTGLRDLSDILWGAEPLSYLIIWYSQHSGWENIVSNVVAAFIFLGGIFALALRSANPWLSLVAATPYLIIVFGMSGIRQAMAVGVIFMAISRWEHSSIFERVVSIAVASLFHTSALVFLIFVVFSTKLDLRMKLFISAMVAIGASISTTMEVPVYAEGVDTLSQRYLDNPDHQGSVGVYFHLSLVVLPAVVVLFFRDWLRPYLPNYEMVILGALCALALVGLASISDTAASRLSIYLHFVPMLVYPALAFLRFGDRAAQSTPLLHSNGNRRRQLHDVSAIVSPTSRLLRPRRLPVDVHRRRTEDETDNTDLVPVLGDRAIVFTIIAFHFIMLGIWLNLGNHSYTFIPYENYLFSG